MQLSALMVIHCSIPPMVTKRFSSSLPCAGVDAGETPLFFAERRVVWVCKR